MKHYQKLSENDLKEYLSFKKLAWAESTYAVEAARLSKYLPCLILGPTSLWDKIQSLKSYSRLILWNRIIELVDWYGGPNDFKDFKLRNRRLFKNCYFKKKLNISYDDIIDRIKSIKSKSIQLKAFELLTSGMRYKESFTRDNNNIIIGKGNKKRKVYTDIKSDFDGSYHTFYRALKQVGLTPHMLRKARATNIADKGAKAHELCDIFGWSSINTAYYYLQSSEESIKDLMK